MTALPPKKRKHPEGIDDAEPSKKKLKKEKKKIKEKTHKEKQKVVDSEFVLIHASIIVSIPPVFASSPAQGVKEMLDSMVMRYIPTLHGVVLTHSNLQFLQSTARIQDACPFALCKVGFDTTVWSPRVGQRLTGQVILCSPDHVSLLVHRTFNVSIPRHHIPASEWTFEWGPAENDPEFGAGAIGEAAEEDADVDMIPTAERDAAAAEIEGENLGRWVHAETGKALGPAVEFTVVGLTIANQMLSLVGSIQPDPFSPRHVPSAQTGSKVGQLENENDEERDGEIPHQDVVEGDDSDDTFALDKHIEKPTPAAEEKKLKKKGKGKDQTAKQKKSKDMPDKDGVIKKSKKKKTVAIDKDNHEKGHKSMDESEQNPKNKKKKKQDV